jgi:hypothetical protein
MLLRVVVGNDKLTPLQMVVSAPTSDCTPGSFTVTVIVAVDAHCPAVGVNV